MAAFSQRLHLSAFLLVDIYAITHSQTYDDYANKSVPLPEQERYIRKDAWEVGQVVLDGKVSMLVLFIVLCVLDWLLCLLDCSKKSEIQRHSNICRVSVLAILLFVCIGFHELSPSFFLSFHSLFFSFSRCHSHHLTPQSSTRRSCHPGNSSKAHHDRRRTSVESAHRAHSTHNNMAMNTALPAATDNPGSHRHKAATATALAHHNHHLEPAMVNNSAGGVAEQGCFSSFKKWKLCRIT